MGWLKPTILNVLKISVIRPHTSHTRPSKKDSPQPLSCVVDRRVTPAAFFIIIATETYHIINQGVIIYSVILGVV